MCVLYYADILPRRFPEFFQRTQHLFQELKISTKPIGNCRDAAIADFLPVLFPKQMVWFTYKPGKYHRSVDKFFQTHTQELTGLPELPQLHQTRLKAEPGMFVNSEEVLCFSEKVYILNNRYKREVIRNKLRRLTGIDEVISIPHLPYDPTFHLQNCLRRLGKKWVFSDVYPYPDKVQERFRKKLLRLPGETIWLSNGFRVDWNDNQTAEGLYINFLQVGNYLLYPQFEMKHDARAQEQFEALAQQNKWEAIAIPCMETAKAGFGLSRLYYAIR